MRFLLGLICVLSIVSCKDDGGSSAAASTSVSCRGIYEVIDSTGHVHKYNEYLQDGRCLTDNLPLSHLELTQQNWRLNNVQCVPQPGFSSRTVVAANNYYSYRNQRAFIDFNSATGIYRRLIKAQLPNGQEVYGKLQGCFYQRSDPSYGDQILLDTDINHIISNQSFDPMEIFSYTDDGTSLNMIRFDQTADYDYTFCPTLKTSFQYCSLLRNGNILLYPVLTPAQQDSLKTEAILLSTQFNYTRYDKSAFETLWSTISNSEQDHIREDYLYDVIFIPDVPWYISDAWRAFLMNESPTMPAGATY